MPTYEEPGTVRERFDDLWEQLHKLADYCGEIAEDVFEMRLLLGREEQGKYFNRTALDAAGMLFDLRSDIQTAAADLDCLRSDLVNEKGGTGARYEVSEVKGRKL